MTLKKWIGEDELCAKIIKGASVAVLAAAALAIVIGEITVLQGDGTHYIRYYAELPCDKLDALARENRRAGK